MKLEQLNLFEAKPLEAVKGKSKIVRLVEEKTKVENQQAEVVESDSLTTVVSEKPTINVRNLTDEEIEQELIKHEAMVHEIANRYRAAARKKMIDYDDLFQVGWVGLYNAILRFDDTLGHQFSTFAYAVIRGSVLSEFGAYERGMKYSQKALALRNKIIREKQEFETAEEIAEHNDTSVKLAYEALHAVRNFNLVELDRKVDNDGDTSNAMVDAIESPNDQIEEIDIIESIFNLFTDEEREMVILKSEGYNQGEIASRMKINQSTISRMIKKVQRKVSSHYKTLNDL